MAEKSGLFNAQNDEPAYTDYDVASFLELIVQGTGVLQGYKDELKVTSDTGLQVKIASGGAWLGEPSGWWYINDEEVTLDVDEEETDNRIDRVVLRLDRNTDARNISLQILKGESAVEPETTELTQNGMVYEISLAQVYVTGGSAILTITDERGSEACNWLSMGGNAIKYPTTIAKGYAGLKDDNGDWVVAQNGVGVSDGSHLVTQGICKLDDLQVGYNYYVQEDGSVGLIITEYKLGYALTSMYLEVNLQGNYGENVEYTDEMINVNAVPRQSGQLEVRLLFHEDADGGEVYIDTGAYEGEGRGNWGTLVEDVIDITTYTGATNNYLLIEGLTAGTLYHLMVFPYKNGTFNESNVETHKTSAIPITTILAKYTFDNISGSTVLDYINSYNMTNNSGNLVEGLIQNAMYLTGVSTSYLSYGARILISGTSGIVIHFKLTDLDGYKCLYSETWRNSSGPYEYGFSVDISPDGNLQIRNYSSTSSTNKSNTFATSFALNTWYTAGIDINLVTGGAFDVYINGDLFGSGTLGTFSTRTECDSFIGYTTNEAFYSSLIVDTISLFNNTIGATNHTRFHNNGLGM